MDTLAHAVYGATFFSLSGWAGGCKTPASLDGKRLWQDPSLWMAGAFGILPDAGALGLPFLLHASQGLHHFFSQVSDEALMIYRLLHNLPVPLLVSLLLWRFRPRWAIPSLAWGLHVIMDAFSHGPGIYQTRPFYPFSGWACPGLNWWQHPWMIWTCWLLLVPAWSGLWWCRRRPGRPS